MNTRVTASAPAAVVLCGLLAALTPNAAAQLYTFTSGPSGDGFNWPAFPTGLLPGGEVFFTPDGIEFYNYTGNNLFFDDNYQVAGNSPDIDGDAMWGNPNSGEVDIFFNGLGAQSVEFGFAQSVGGAPFQTNDYVDIYIEDSDGRATVYSQFLGNTFTGLGGFDGYSDLVQFDTSFLVDDFDSVDGGPLIDIEYIYIDLFSLDNTSEPAEFAIDNFRVDDTTGGGLDEVYVSTNQGTDVSGATLGSNSLRGVGTHTVGVEVTNGGSGDASYSIQIDPGGDLTAGPSVVSGDFIAAGVSEFQPNIASIDRSLPSGTYESDVRVINDGDPTDPDNVATLSIDLYEPEMLSGNFADVDVNNFEDVTLGNAAAPANGFRAAVKATGGSTTTGPFQVDAWAADTRLLDGDTIQANVVFKRFGQLAGVHTGTHTASFEQAAYVINQFVDIEVFLSNKEPVPDQVWNLSYTLTENSTDNGNFTTGFTLADRIGVSTFEMAATLIDGTSGVNQSIGMQVMANPDPASAELIGDAVDLVFGGGGGEQYVLQFTYDEALVPGGFLESQLQVLWYDPVAEDWTFAIDGNSSTTSTFFSGSYEDYLAGPGGGTFDAGDLGAFGVDTGANRVWAVLDHASLFGVGVLGAAEILGDYNDSGLVEQGDLDQVLANWGAGFASIPGSWVNQRPTEGIVDQAELDVVLTNWGSSSAPDFGASNVPEPGALAVLCLLATRWRRRH